MQGKRWTPPAPGALSPPPAPTWRGAGPTSPRGDSRRPAPSSPLPLGGRSSRDSSPGPPGCSGGCSSGGSPVSKSRPSRSAPPGVLVSPPSRRLLGDAEGSVITAESILRFRGSSETPRGCPGCETACGGTQRGSGGSSGKSQSRSRFQGTWNVSGSAARRLAMGPTGSGRARRARKTERR